MMESAKLHYRYNNVLEVRNDEGFTLWYLLRDGNFYPGRVYRSLSPTGQAVEFFMPIPDGLPTVLAVEEL